MLEGGPFGTAAADGPVGRLAVAVSLGLFLGLEREWSQKAAGIRTFALVSVLGALFVLADATTCGSAATLRGCVPVLTAVGGLFAVVLAGLLVFDGVERGESLHLTTAVSLVVAYGTGVLVGLGLLLPATVVAVTSSLLLVLKRELHGFAWGLSREEVRSTTEFAILAFVVYPLLPTGSVTVLPDPVSVTVEPRVVWLMVVFVAAIGMVNYVIVQAYGGRGVAVTGFFGGLASSTAVVGTMRDYVDQRPEATSYAVAAVVLADAAMALRNLLIAVLFTLTGPRSVLVSAAVPLAVVIAAAVASAYLVAEWSETVTMELDTPFSMQNALGFGVLFLVVVLAGGIASATFGTAGLYVTALVSGLVSSAGATTSAVVLYRNGTIAAPTATVAVLLATAASVAVKAALVARTNNSSFFRDVAGWSAVLLVAGGVACALVLV